MRYWFYRLKEIVDSPYSFNNVDNIEQDVFIASDRDAAKKYLQEKYPNLPLRKPKNAKLGTQYLYLIESDVYWYNRLYGEVQVQCCWCNKSTIVIGEKNVLHNRNGDFCSTECKEANELKENSEWIDKDDHVGIKPQKGIFVGYIYKITNKRTMNCYVGQTVNVPIFRWWQHLKCEGKFEQTDLSELVFEVLEVIHYDSEIEIIYKDAKDKLNKREAYFIRLFNSVDEGYNEVQPKEHEATLFDGV